MSNHSLKEHEELCILKLGKPFTEVHKWMDRFSRNLQRSHRIRCHNIIRTPIEAKKRFGKDADKACITHLILDTLDYIELAKDDYIFKRTYEVLIKKSEEKYQRYLDTIRILKEVRL